MAWMDSIKGALFNPDPAAVVAQPTNASPSTGAQPSVILANEVSPLNAEMVQAIRKAVFGRNTALTALLTASNKLASIIPDPVQRLKAAFATSADGRTVQQITEAITIHLADVDSEELRFSSVLKQANINDVGSLNAEAESKKQLIVNASAEIQQLQARLGILDATIATLSTEANVLNEKAASKAAELNTAEAQFKIAAADVRQELNGHKSTIMASLG